MSCKEYSYININSYISPIFHVQLNIRMNLALGYGIS